MIDIQSSTDKSAILISMLCIIHCLVLPIAIILIPSIAALSLADEAFHQWMLFAVLPISIFALTRGCKKHKKYYVFAWGALGLAILFTGFYLGHDLLGETGEKLLTVIGASVIALGHLRNFQLCRQVDCECQELPD